MPIYTNDHHDGCIPPFRSPLFSSIGIGPKVTKAIDDATRKWLDDHPEATTTVEDGSLEERKLKPSFSLELCRCFDTVGQMQNAADLKAGMTCHTNGFHFAGDGGAAFYRVTEDSEPNDKDVLALQGGLFATLVVTEPYVTPEMFGAYGDGEHDDSAILLWLIDNLYSIFLINTYYIANSIATSSKCLNIRGNFERSPWYGSGRGGKILVADGVSVFKDATISGQICNCAFVGQGANVQTSDTIQYLFDNCTVNNFKFDKNYVYNFEAVFLNTIVNSVANISNNMFLSCYYFAKVTINKWCTFSDSNLVNNYINGGNKYNNNSCFQWQDFPASILMGNFIDFYRTIYDPSANRIHSNVNCNINSINDRYEYFRYFMSHIGVNDYIATISNPNFTHLNPTLDTKLSSYEAITYTEGGVTYEYDPFLFRVPLTRDASFSVVFTNVKFHANTSQFKPINVANMNASLLFDSDVLANVTFEVSKRTGFADLFNRQNSDFSYYGKNHGNLITTNYIKVLDTEPSFTAGFQQTNDIYPGVTYIWNGITYKCIIYNDGSWKIGLKNVTTGTIDFHN